jgi:predicted outer membrane lipoprotein
MKIALGILVAAAFGVVTNLVSDLLAPHIRKRKKLVVISFAVLLGLTVVLAPYDDTKKQSADTQSYADNTSTSEIQSRYETEKLPSPSKESTPKSQSQLAEERKEETSPPLQDKKTIFVDTRALSNDENVSPLSDLLRSALRAKGFTIVGRSDTTIPALIVNNPVLSDSGYEQGKDKRPLRVSVTISWSESNQVLDLGAIAVEGLGLEPMDAVRDARAKLAEAVALKVRDALNPS